MRRKVERPDVRTGYDRWAETYDDTPNPVVALDRRVTLQALNATGGETMLDAGCGTGAHLRLLQRRGLRTLGLDLSFGMLRVARRAAPDAWLAQADLNGSFPIRPGAFDAVLSSLVSEHLTNLERFFAEIHSALRGGGRLIFSAFHPELARAGVEANFESAGTEYRLGAAHYSVDEYLQRISDAGFHIDWSRDCFADAALADAVPTARKYLRRPLILLVQARRVA
jgi:SAM-dependent methyltransferase